MAEEVRGCTGRVGEGEGRAGTGRCGEDEVAHFLFPSVGRSLTGWLGEGLLMRLRLRLDPGKATRGFPVRLRRDSSSSLLWSKIVNQ